MSRLPLALALLPALALARLLPEHGVGLGLRLAVATAVVLLPGALIARALGRPGGADTLAWSLMLILGGLAVMFALGGSLAVVIIVPGVAGLVALPFALRRLPRAAPPGTAWAAALGVVLGVALWHVAGHVDGDALFHLGRVRKLAALDGLSLEAVGEFRDGGLHPGYAVPLWHGLLALVARAAGVDPAAVVLHEASVLAPLALVIAYQAAWALFRSGGLAIAAVVAQVGLIGLAAGHGGAYTSLALPATSSRQLLVPAVLAAFFAYARRGDRAALASVAAASLALVVVHPSYALFLAVPLGGMLLVRALLAPGGAARIALGLAAVLAPVGAYLLWLLPVIRETASHEPGAQELARAFRQYVGQLDVTSGDHYRLAPELFGRSGAIAVAALLLVPLAAFAGRRLWASYVVGGTLAVVAICLTPQLFVPFADAVSLSQARRLAGFLPFAFAVAGGLAILARPLGVAVLPLALGGGIALQLAYPGDFGYRLETGGPPLATWTAAVGAALAVPAMLALRRRELLPRAWLAAAAAVLLVLPVGVHAAASWTPRPDKRPTPLAPALVARLPERAVVFSDLETSYRLLAAAPVYVAAAPPAHVADTEDNRPYERRRDVIRFFRDGDLAVPRSYGAGWLLIDRRRFPGLRISARLDYHDARYDLYRAG